MPINKIVGSFDEAVADVEDGSVIHIGGFGGPAEYPSYLIAALARKGVVGGYGAVVLEAQHFAQVRLHVLRGIELLAFARGDP